MALFNFASLGKNFGTSILKGGADVIKGLASELLGHSTAVNYNAPQPEFTLPAPEDETQQQIPGRADPLETGEAPIKEPDLQKAQAPQQIRLTGDGDDIVKQLETFHNGIVNYLNAINKNAVATYEYVEKKLSHQDSTYIRLDKKQSKLETDFRDIDAKLLRLDRELKSLEAKKKPTSLIPDDQERDKALIVPPGGDDKSTPATRLEDAGAVALATRLATGGAAGLLAAIAGAVGWTIYKGFKGEDVLGNKQSQQQQWKSSGWGSEWSGEGIGGFKGTPPPQQQRVVPPGNSDTQSKGGLWNWLVQPFKPKESSSPSHDGGGKPLGALAPGLGILGLLGKSQKAQDQLAKQQSVPVDPTVSQGMNDPIRTPFYGPPIVGKNTSISATDEIEMMAAITGGRGTGDTSGGTPGMPHGEDSVAPAGSRANQRAIGIGQGVPGQRQVASLDPSSGVSSRRGLEGVDEKVSPVERDPPRSEEDLRKRQAAAADDLLAMKGNGPDSQLLLKYFKDGGVGLNPRQLAWCAATVDAAYARHGLSTPQGSNRFMASTFRNYGVPETEGIHKGDVVYTSQFGRGSGHVGVATGNINERGQYEVIAGNTGHKVNTFWADPRQSMIRRPAPIDDQQAQTASRVATQDRAHEFSVGGYVGNTQRQVSTTNESSRALAATPDRRFDKSIPASIRYNNPGAQWPHAGDERFGMDPSKTGIIGGGNKIAYFPNPVQGLAANMNLLNSPKYYLGHTIGQAISNWSNGGRSTVPGLPSKYGQNTVITKEMLNDPEFMVPFFRTMQGAESGRGQQLSDAQIRQAFEIYRAGSVKAYAEQQTSQHSMKVAVADAMQFTPQRYTRGQEHDVTAPFVRISNEEQHFLGMTTIEGGKGSSSADQASIPPAYQRMRPSTNIEDVRHGGVFDARSDDAIFKRQQPKKYETGSIQSIADIPSSEDESKAWRPAKTGGGGYGEVPKPDRNVFFDSTPTAKQGGKLSPAKPDNSHLSPTQTAKQQPWHGPKPTNEPTSLQQHAQPFTSPRHNPEQMRGTAGNAGYGDQWNPDGIGLCSV